MRLNNRSIFRPHAKSTPKIENKVDEVTLYLYDEISWWGIQAEQFVKDLGMITAGTIHLRFNTPGGSVFDGMSIYNAIKQHKAKVVGHVDGLAASISSVILMACDEVRMGEGGFIMIHEPWSLVVGAADDMRKEADLLDKVEETIIGTYENKCKKKTKDEIREMMKAETWMNATDAMENGFCDCMDEADEDEDDKKKKKKNAILFDLSAFANVPDSLKEAKLEPTVREAEKALRDVGFSQQQAKVILAEGFKAEIVDQRDADPVIPPLPTPPPVVDQRDADPPPPKKKDRITDLLVRAEMLAPSK
jgi:ATP-dependent Clp protease protease subunit